MAAAFVNANAHSSRGMGRLGPRLGRAFCAATVLASFVLPVRAADPFPPLPGETVDVVVSIAPGRALDAEFADAVRGHVDRMLSKLLGSPRAVRRVEPPQLLLWMESHSLAELTADECLKLGCDPAGKTILLSLRHDGAYRLEAVEFDGHFGDLGPARQAAVLQRPLVADNLGRLAVRSYTPVGEIQKQDGPTFSIGVRRQEDLLASPEWSRLHAGSVLRIYRETLLPGGEVDQQARRDQFLIVERAAPQEILARAILTVAGDKWFRQPASRSRYLVRRIDPKREPVTVRVVLSETSAPREGCEVYVSQGAAAGVRREGKLLGMTDARGEFTFTPDAADLCLVTVKYDSLEFTQAVAPGVTPNPRTVTVASRSPLLELELELTNLHERFGDAVIGMNDLIARRDAAGNAGDVAQADALAKQARSAIDLEKYRKALGAIEDRAKQQNLAMSDRFSEVRGDIDRIERQLDPTAGKRAVDTARSRQIQDELKVASENLDWKRVETLYDEFCRLNPADKGAADALAKLRAELAPANAAHAAARASVDKASLIRRIEDLIAQWSEISTSVGALVRAKDTRWLLKVERAAVGWQDLANADAVRVSDEIQDPKTAGDDARLAALDKRLEDLDVVLKGLERLRGSVADELKNSRTK